jgi:3-deoxy-manno-octulosonate cytidylyltransferase (CMP-KDO synthetase)
MKVIAIIPARYASTRFPGKPLVSIQGKTMIRRVVEQVQQVPGLLDVIVGTDDKRIEAEVKSFGGKVIQTSADHPSGTDRVYEAYVKSGITCDFILNVQGDEPFIQPEQIQNLLSVLQPSTELATLVKPIQDGAQLSNPNIVKAVFSDTGNAIYFSRNPIPFLRGTLPVENWIQQAKYYKHIGMYAYRSDILEKITQLQPSPLEVAESLEQLRWLENGYKIQTAITQLETVGIDTPEDLNKLSI